MEKIKYNLEELHRVQLEILKKLITVCEEHHFSYFLGFGSLLGAAREHKILAWDDSIDVVMPYRDFAALTELPEEEWGEGLFLQTYDTDPEYPKYYAKLRDSRTTMVLSEYAGLDMNHGIFINIMPLIKLAYDGGERKRQIRDARLYKAFTERKLKGTEEQTLSLYNSAVLALSTESQAKERRDALKEKVLQYEGTEARECFALAGNRSLELALPVAWFREAVECEFEGLQVKIPEGWDAWLRLRYGDYKKVPIADLQGEKTLHFVTLSTTRPYTYYKGKTYCPDALKNDAGEAGSQAT